MSYKRSKKPALKPMTIRFSIESWGAIEDMAKKYGINKTELVRMAVTGNLARYLGSIRIIDEGQASEIKELIKSLLDEISVVKMELHRIGINYNQEIRLEQIKRKYASQGMDFYDIEQKRKEIQSVKSECKDFSKEDLDILISRYENATKQVGEILCRILT
ncbi:hypothetical protein [Helicobacter sp.]|uniref:hypothetical protein n=1 Tax=Helicobacter sp. TaxID=218 RepID=UPI00198898CE|nr:hypothetical protein [Helicobacter sp.]MBD5165209.1 hypothetical protein [Helicobacter sp.]